MTNLCFTWRRVTVVDINVPEARYRDNESSRKCGKRIKKTIRVKFVLSVARTLRCRYKFDGCCTLLGVRLNIVECPRSDSLFLVLYENFTLSFCHVAACLKNRGHWTPSRRPCWKHDAMQLLSPGRSRLPSLHDYGQLKSFLFIFTTIVLRC